MFVLYRLEQNGTFERQGIYQFQRGLFGGYRFRSREYDTCPIVNTSLIQIGKTAVPGDLHRKLAEGGCQLPGISRVPSACL